MKKRIIAVILCVVMALSASVVPAGAGMIVGNNRGPVGTFIHGYPMNDVADILKGLYAINKAVNNIIGIPLFAEETLVITVDNTVQGIIDGINEKKGVDFGRVVASLPDLSRSADIITSTLHVNIPVLSKLLEKTADIQRKNGKDILPVLTAFMRLWLCVVGDMQIVLTPVDGQPGVYRFGANVTYRDGSKDVLQSHIVYNENTNELCGIDGRPAIFGFDMDLDQMYTYTGVDVWQRHFGFCFEYDLFCYLTPYIMNYTTQRIKFIYDNREWMCQIWKGTYSITNGGEVGFYTRPIGSLGTFYRCVDDDDMMYMTLDVYHKDELLLSRPRTLHWWVTGFEVDDTGYLPHALTLVTTITMMDKEMLDAFTKALDKKRLVLDYETNGLDVTIKW